MSENSDHYVYVYIDPRNFEEFYYGNGTMDRKYAHLQDESDNKKTERIKEIRDAGLEPIIKVIARGLTQHDALLVEKTLIWKLGRNLTNVSSGHFADKFRPHNTIHLELKGFDHQTGVYLLNVGERFRRSWNDCRKYGFMSAGGGTRYRKLMQEFRPGDIVAAYWSKTGYRGGYVGIGLVKSFALPVAEFKVAGKLLRESQLTQPKIFENFNNADLSEWVVAVKWLSTVSAEECKWIPKMGLFSTPNTKASLEKQIKTLKYLEIEFGVKFDELRRNIESM